MGEQVIEGWINFGKALRRYRSQRGLTLDEASLAIGYGASTIGKYENAQRAPKRQFVVDADAVLRTSGELTRLWEDVKRTEQDPEWHRKVATSEAEASEIKFWNPALVPGMFQTSDYARVIFRDGRPLDSEGAIEQLVDLRVGRRDTLEELSNPRMLVILSESVVRARIGGAEVMRGQLEHMLNLGDRGVVRFLILPTETPFFGGVSGPFRLLTFRERDTLVEVEHISGGELFSGEVATRLTAVYGELQTWALPPAASRDVISRALEGL